MKEEEKKLRLEEQLRQGIRVQDKAPYYLNAAIVGEGYVGYVVSLEDEDGKQFDVVLRARNDKTLFSMRAITMTICKVSRCESASGKRNIISNMIGREVILTPTGKGKAINDYYFINGIFNLKNEPP